MSASETPIGPWPGRPDTGQRPRLPLRGGRCARAWGALALALPLLTGCEALQQFVFGAPPPETEVGVPGEAVASLPEEPIGDPPLPPRRPEPPVGLLLGQPVAAPLDSIETVAEVGTLVGLGFKETETLLGQPTLQEVQPPAQVWSYNGPDCVLNIFFYPQVGGEQYRALAYEVVEPAPGPQSAQRCFTSLVSQHRASGAPSVSSAGPASAPAERSGTPASDAGGPETWTAAAPVRRR